MSDNAKVYLVTTGDYSDRDLAMMFCRHRNGAFAHDGTNGLGEHRITEMALDIEKPAIPAGYDTYEVAITMDGNASDAKVGAFPYDQYTAENATTGSGDYKRQLKFVHGTNKRGYRNWPRQNIAMKDHIIVWCIARDEKHAVKIASERRAVVVANNWFDIAMTPEFDKSYNRDSGRYKTKNDVDSAYMVDIEWPASKNEA